MTVRARFEFQVQGFKLIGESGEGAGPEQVCSRLGRRWWESLRGGGGFAGGFGWGWPRVRRGWVGRLGGGGGFGGGFGGGGAADFRYDRNSFRLGQCLRDRRRK